jgi:hypothetical protein
VAFFTVLFLPVALFAVALFAVAFLPVGLFAVAFFAVAFFAVAFFTVVFLRLRVALFVGTVYLPSDAVLSSPVITSLKAPRGKRPEGHVAVPSAKATPKRRAHLRPTARMMHWHLSWLN